MSRLPANLARKGRRTRVARFRGLGCKRSERAPNFDRQSRIERNIEEDAARFAMQYAASCHFGEVISR
jgi:hypothetical protein